MSVKLVLLSFKLPLAVNMFPYLYLWLSYHTHSLVILIFLWFISDGVDTC